MSATAQEQGQAAGREEKGGAPRAQLARSSQQRGARSLRELVGSDRAMTLMLAWLGAIGEEDDGRSLAEALELGRLVPGVCVLSRIKVGPAGANLLATDAWLGGLRLCRGSSWPHVLGALKLNTGLRTLDLRECGLGPADAALLAEVLAVNVCLTELELRANCVGEAGGRALATVLETNATLRVLGLRGTWLGEGGGHAVGAMLATNKGLRGLDLGENHLSEANGRAMAAALTTNATLRTLSLAGNLKLGDDASAAILRVLVNRSLEELNLRDTALEKASSVLLADVVRGNCTLQVLDLSDNDLGRDDDASTSSWPQVLKALKHNVNLHTLRLEDCELTANDGQVLAKALEQQPSGLLRELNVGTNPDMEDNSCRAIIAACLKPGSAMRKLELKQTSMGRAAGLALASCLRANHTLEELDLSGNSLGRAWDGSGGSSWPQVLKALGDNVGLRTLRLEECLTAVDGQALAKALEQRPVGLLRELGVFGNEDLGDAACSAIIAACLKPGSSLHTLDLSCTDMGRAPGVLLAGCLRANLVLAVLKLSGNMLGRAEDGSGSSSWPHVLAALEENLGLHTLELGGCGLTADDGQALAKALHQRPSGVLQELDLRGNPRLGDDACAAVIAACLRPGSALRILCLESTEVGRAAGLVLAGLLRENRTLEVLDISSELDVVDAAYDGTSWPELFAALAVNTGLRTLSLDGCGLNKQCNVEALAAGLRANRVLQEFFLRAEDLRDGGASVLAAGLATNAALRKLNLNGCPLRDAALLAFASLFQTNTALRELELSVSVAAAGDAAQEALKLAGRTAGCSITIEPVDDEDFN